ncbi:MAG: hypothetical protein V1848_00950 [Candidatus Magasanikbacteria bacterium]
MKKNIFSFIFGLGVLSCLLLPQVSFALSQIDAQTSAIAGEQGANFGEARDPRTIAATIINLALGATGVALIAYIVYGGYLILFSQGKEDMITKGRKSITSSVIGLLILLTSYSIVLFVTKVLLTGDEASTPDGIFYERLPDETNYGKENVYNNPDEQQFFPPPNL